jgi:Dolichyl-phosphate-mannose-protein mannosyltransferase
MKKTRTARWFALQQPMTIVIGLIGLALGLRIWGIWFGLPFIFHNDEDLEVVRALQLGSGSFDFQRIYKGGYFYLLFFEYGILFVGLKISGIVNSASEFAHYYFSDPSVFYLIGRATSTIIGAVNVYLVYRIGRLAYSERAGLIAATFLAVNILHVKLSHYIIVDIPMTCLVTAAIYFAVKIAMGGTRSDYVWAAVLTALATTTKVTAILLIAPMVVSHYFCVAGRDSRPLQFVLDKQLWQAIIAFIVVYAVTTPGIVLHFDSFIGFMMSKFGADVHGASVDALESTVQSTMLARTNLFQFYFDVIKDSMTVPIFLICLVGLGYGLWKRSRADLVLMSCVFVFYLMLSITTDTREFFPRYILPAIPMIALLGARLLDDILGRFKRVRKLPAGVLLAVLLGILPASRIAAENYLMTQKDTRASASEWFETNVPAGSRVFIEGTRTRPSESTVPLENSRENVRAMIEQYSRTEPGKAKYFSIKMDSIDGPTYDLVLVRMWDLQDIQHYKGLGVEYFILRPDNYEGSRRQSDWPKIVAQLRDDPEASLVKSFKPDPASVPGPFIEIYRVDRNRE